MTKGTCLHDTPRIGKNTSTLMNTYSYIAEKCLHDEVQAILDVVQSLDDNFIRAVDMILSCKGKVIVTGVGNSGHIGAKIASTMSSSGTPALFMNAVDAYHGNLGAVTEGDVLLVVSKSGETSEILRLLPYIQECNVPVISITSAPDSTLGVASECILDIRTKTEACPINLVPTSSTIVSMALGDALACALIEARKVKPADVARVTPGGLMKQTLNA